MSLTSKKPWYREFYVWLVIFFPALAIVAGLYTLKLAIDSDDGLVVDDYYKQGVEINRVLERDKRALQRGLAAELSLDSEHKMLHVVLSHSQAEYKLPEKLLLRCVYGTKSGLDLTLNLQRVANNSYYAPLPDLKVGGWNLQLEADDWRLIGRVNMPATQVVNLIPTI
jgi:uncharacterized protein